MAGHEADLRGDNLADMDKHTDEQLREGIHKVDEQEPRVDAEDSEAAHRKQQEQREAMEQELQERGQ